FLSPRGGLHSGYMIAQYVAAALVSEAKSLAHPASVDSIPTSGLVEDYNSMGAGAWLKARDVAGRLRQVLAIELLLAAQALGLRGAPRGSALARRLAPGRGSRPAPAALRAAVAPLDADRLLSADLAAALAVVESGAVVEAAEVAVGALA